MNHISWNVTKRCNLFCDHCYRDSGPYTNTNTELSTEEGKKLVREIKKAGLNIIVFSGGEPLLRGDIYELIEYTSSLGITSFMGSNGTLINQEVAKHLKEIGLDAIAISLDSLTPKVHDQFRKVEGSYYKAVQGIQYCVEAGLRVQVNPTITKQNHREVLDIIEKASSLGASSCHFLFLVAIGRGKKCH